jgi:hypothetical protein
MPRIRALAMLGLVGSCSLSLSVVRSVHAAPIERGSDAPAIPAALLPYRDWVLFGQEQLGCPNREGEALCFWPSRLALDLSEAGGSFGLDVVTDRSGLLALPGEGANWPRAVRVDGKAAVVIAQEERPHVQLPPGKHRIEGRFVWRELPQTLSVPALYALIGLRLSGHSIERPKRDPSAGSLWLQAPPETAAASQLELNVQRKLIDAVPLLLDTRIRLRAAGPGREVDLGVVLPAGAVALTLSSELPARLEPNGRLRLQVRPGSFEIELRARLPATLTRIETPTRSAPWPAEESWVFQADEALRQVALSGLRGADPVRLELDPTWRGLPTFVAAGGDTLVLKTLRRGDPEPLPNQLDLQRTLWLDQDGRGYSVYDRISGQMHSGFRLDLIGLPLGRVVANGRDQLITRVGARAPSGVELRQTYLELQAEYCAEQLFSELPAVAWSEDMHSLAITLKLPPGYQLFAARGVDRVDRSWLQDWDLLGFFFVLLLALGTGRVAGLGFGVIAFVALGLAYQEPDAPKFAWIGLLALVALLRAVPEGRARAALRVALAFAALAFALTVVPFAARSLREAVYPQLGRRYDLPLQPTAAAVADAGAASSRLDGAGSSGMLRKFAAAPPAPTPPLRAASAEDPDAVVQTGPGLPDWQWQSWKLTWSGPVRRDHHFELFIVRPALFRALCVLRVVLAALLLFGLWRAVRPALRPSRFGPVAPLLMLALGAAPVHADFPSPGLLDDLRARLTAPPACRPDCVSVAESTLEVGPRDLRWSGEIDALDASSVRVPGPVASWSPSAIRIDGAPAAVLLHPDGFLHVRVAPGTHRVEVTGALPSQDSLTLQLGDRPQTLDVNAQGYEVNGLHADGSVGDSIELRRLLPAAVNLIEDAPSLPPWLELTRDFDLALTFQVHNRLSRTTPLGRSVVVHVPLLAGEAVNDERVEVRAGEAIVTLGPDESELAFDSSLPQRRDFELRASDRYSELWRLRCGTMWQCRTEGLPPIALSGQGAAPIVVNFRPWPNERLQLHLLKPSAAPGQVATIDRAQLEVTPGVRQTDSTLSLHWRTSGGGSHALTLPAATRVRSLSVNGAARPVHPNGRVLSFALPPGAADVEIGLEHAGGMQNVFASPAIASDTPISNGRVVIHPPADVWLLWLAGPAWGPAVLFWGQLAVALFAALVLGRGATLVRPYEWLLLALGLTQVDVSEALPVAGFFFAMAWRERSRELPVWWFNLRQVALGFLSLFAGLALFDAVRRGLLVQPDMQVAGAEAGRGALEWYVDRSGGALPVASVISLPLWVYRALMLAWALWLVRALMRWLPWALRAFLSGGGWKRWTRRPVPPPPAAGS